MKNSIRGRERKDGNSQHLLADRLGLEAPTTHNPKPMSARARQQQECPSRCTVGQAEEDSCLRVSSTRSISERQGFKNRTDNKNRSTPVLLKTTKTEKTGSFLVQNSFFEIWEKKIETKRFSQKLSSFFGLSIDFRMVFYSKFKI
jgi:hypothetical protein